MARHRSGWGKVLGMGMGMGMGMGLAGVWGLGATARGADRATLAESPRVGDASRVVVELKAEGTFRPSTSPGGPEGKPLKLKVATRVEFDERVAGLGVNNVADRATRLVNRASASIDGEVRPSTSSLRPALSALAATRRGDQSVEVASLGGPLTRKELELVSGPGDPLALPTLLPPLGAASVKVGDRWTVGELAARNLSGYDAIAVNALEATLDSVDEASAKVRLLGNVRGAALGGEGSMACDGTATFDRKLGRVTRLVLNRAETRRPGPVEAGLDMKSTLTVDRSALEPAGTPLPSDAASLAKAFEDTPGRDLLMYSPLDGRYEMLVDRDWHLFWEDSRQAVFKRLDHGELVAQLNVADGPDAGKGRHQDLDQFRSDVKRALGDRLVGVVGEGEVDGVQADAFRHKLTARGKQGDAGILWHYYLLAAPDGRQLIATFTLGLAQQAQFADQDLRLIGSLEWKPKGAAK